MPMQRDLYPDDVTLRTCPCCGGKAVRVAAPKPNDPKGWVYHTLRCENYCLVTTWQCTPEKAAEIWNTRVSDPRVAALEAQLAEARDWSSTLADAADDLRAELRDAQEALSTSGIGGIYDTFQDVGDAIRQMAAYIKERDARIAELEAALAAGREGTCETCAHAHEYEGALSCGLTESGRAIAHMMDCSYWEPKEDA